MKAKYLGNYWKQDILQGWPNDPKEEAELKALEEASKKATETNLTGFIMEFSVADGRAKYVVMRDTKTELTIAKLNEGDNWDAHPSIVKNMTRTEMLGQLRFRKLCNR